MQQQPQHANGAQMNECLSTSFPCVRHRRGTRRRHAMRGIKMQPWPSGPISFQLVPFASQFGYIPAIIPAPAELNWAIKVELVSKEQDPLPISKKFHGKLDRRSTGSAAYREAQAGLGDPWHANKEQSTSSNTCACVCGCSGSVLKTCRMRRDTPVDACFRIAGTRPCSNVIRRPRRKYKSA